MPETTEEIINAVKRYLEGTGSRFVVIQQSA